LISNFNSLSIRTDIGPLWENFLISERYKRNIYSLSHAGYYFWRTTQQQEIDYIEELDGKLNCYEFKWNPNKKTSLSATFSSNYPESTFTLISSNNYLDFIGG
jgi:predicted AAA+ superfamily ATPase